MPRTTVADDGLRDVAESKRSRRRRDHGSWHLWSQSFRLRPNLDAERSERCLVLRRHSLAVPIHRATRLRSVACISRQALSLRRRDRPGCSGCRRRVARRSWLARAEVCFRQVLANVAGTDLHGSHVVLCRHAPSPDDLADAALLPRPCRQPPGAVWQWCPLSDRRSILFDCHEAASFHTFALPRHADFWLPELVHGHPRGRWRRCAGHSLGDRDVRGYGRLSSMCGLACPRGRL